MKSSITNLSFLFFSLLLSTSAIPSEFSIVGYEQEDLTSHDSLIDLFESWMAKHGKSYATISEILRRFEVFKDNLKHIDETNKKRTNYWLGLNEFADLSHEEFKLMYLGLKPVITRRREATSSERSEFMYENDVELPKSVDWRKKGAITPVKNQGACGKNPGGEFQGALQVVTITGYEDVPANDEASLLKALAHQPVSVAIEASGRDFQFYTGGVFDGPCGTELDHGVAAVGYGSSKGQDYIIVKNSWGSKWGEKGYIRMKRSAGNNEGLCGINKMASYPTKKT